MNFDTPANFIKKYGVRGIRKFQDLCNSGATLEDIKEDFPYSIPELSRIRGIIFERKYVFAESTLRVLDGHLNNLDFQREDILSLLSENQHIHDKLTFLPGGKVDNSAEHTDRA